MPDLASTGEQFRVHHVGLGLRQHPRLAVWPDGRVLAAWDGLGRYLQRGVQVRQLAPMGAPLTFELPASTAAGPGSALVPDVAVLADDTVVAVWQSEGQDGDGAGIFAQRLDSGLAKIK